MSRDEQTIAFSVTDNGPGIKNPDNLFIPYYSTKKSGSGIGLVLCRQIIRNHNGELTLQNKPDEQGVIATIRLPLSAVVWIFYPLMLIHFSMYFGTIVRQYTAYTLTILGVK